MELDISNWFQKGLHPSFLTIQHLLHYVQQLKLLPVIQLAQSELIVNVKLLAIPSVVAVRKQSVNVQFIAILAVLEIKLFESRE